MFGSNIGFSLATIRRRTPRSFAVFSSVVSCESQHASCYGCASSGKSAPQHSGFHPKIGRQACPFFETTPAVVLAILDTVGKEVAQQNSGTASMTSTAPSRSWTSARMHLDTDQQIASIRHNVALMTFGLLGAS